MVLATDRSLREDKKDAPDELSGVHFFDIDVDASRK